MRIFLQMAFTYSYFSLLNIFSAPFSFIKNFEDCGFAEQFFPCSF